MAWDGYIDNLMGQDMDDAVIVGCQPGQEYVWASNKTGKLKDVTAEEVQVLQGHDRDSLFAKGLTLAGCKCTMVRDGIKDDFVPYVDLRTKGTDNSAICVAKTNQAVIILKGKKETHAGVVNDKVLRMADYLRKANY
ncbi:profilin-1-like [Anguilla rostrata]|uniref:profilin-1-like n=1 Tax=Anguilla rostrata TaxID=7938 RepID=UPI0030CCF7DC